VASHLGIPFRLLDVQDEFKRGVVDYFINEYANGRTPCPCVPCNRTIRFGLLMDLCLRSGARFLATGHYARVQKGERRYHLLRGVDRQKDQSYFLHILDQRKLAHILFPLGEMTKPDVRKLAQARGLPVAEQPESQDLCFLANDDYREFLRMQIPSLFDPGPIRDRSGQVLGEHQGLPSYTVGQRKGLNVSGPEPYYVLEILPEENALVIGTRADLGRRACTVDEMHYVTGEMPEGPFRAGAKIRSQADLTPVTVTPISEGRARVAFEVEQRDLTPGQFLVLYQDEEALGGGVILSGR
jgi:tRNA-specific 2-thiouridylase